MDAIEFSDELYRRALVSAGSPERLLRFRRMVAEGRPVVYGAIGGSITEGAAASSPGSRYVSCIAHAIQNRTACRLVNAGVGATDTRFGAMRCREDLLRHRPDLITIEYAVNDVNNPDRDFSFEALVRQCMGFAPDALIVVIFTLREDGVSMQEIQLPVCRHYDLAMISYHDAIWPELSGGNLAWSAVSPDNIHPNDVGHRLIADLVTRLLFGQPVEAVPLKAPLDLRCAEYEGGRVVRAEEFEVDSVRGWEIADSVRGYRRWTASEPGAELSFTFSGPTLLIGYRKYAGEFGRVSVSVDGGEETVLEGFFEMPPGGTWRGGHIALEKILHAAGDGPHQVTVKLLPDRHPESAGHRFDIEYLLKG